MNRVTTAARPESFTTFGDLLKHVRKLSHLTQDELGRAVGYSREQINRLEKNQRLPDLATIVASFVPALQLDDQPALTQQLLELASVARGSANKITITRTIKREISESVEREEVVPASLNRLSGVPFPLLPLIGRESELAQIHDRILNPATR